MGGKDKVRVADHLTSVHSPMIAKAVHETFAGMAGWAGSGPSGMTCRHCDHFATNGWYAARGAKRGLLKPGKCRWARNYTGRKGSSFPHDARACNKFSENTSPPPISSPERGA